MEKIKDIANFLGVDQAYVGRIFSGKQRISWNLSAKMASLFPGKTIAGWKKAPPQEIRHAFRLLDEEYQGINKKEVEKCVRYLPSCTNTQKNTA